jgi:acyl-CoA synthetase (AMP-forming)/AMP-acid ligase II
MHSDDTLATLNRQFAERFDLSDTTPIFMPSPLGHSVGSIHGARLAMWAGAPLILQPEWDPVGALTLVERYGAHFTAAATPFLSDLLDVEWSGERPKLAGLKWFLCGGTQVPPSMVRRARREFPETSVTPLWGMTEGGLTTCLGDESTPTQTEETVGVGLPDLELRVLTDDGTLLPAGAGELAMRGPGVFLGYLGQEDLYREQLTGDGFFRTGDLACIDAEGYVSITGRVKDMIIRGGVNISPVRTENVTASHPAVSGVAVIGWPDERLGERLCAVVSVRDDPPTLKALIAFCADQSLERRGHPERLVLVDDFPRTAAGKIRKRQLLADLLASEMP